MITLSLCLLAVACSSERSPLPEVPDEPSPSGLLIAIEPAVVAAGGDVRATFVGPESAEVSFGVEAHLDRWETDAWVPTHRLASRADGRPPGRSSDISDRSFTVPGIALIGVNAGSFRIPDVEPGLYRIVKEVGIPEGQAETASGQFEVR